MPKQHHKGLSTPAAALILIGVLGLSVRANAAESFSGYEVPRFVTLKASRVNARQGPSKEYPIEWQYRLRGLPVEVIAETEEWRQIRDWDGGVGWIHHTLLSGSRTLFVTGDGTGRKVPMHEDPKADALVNALAEPGALGEALECKPDWCLLDGGDYNGWVHKSMVWGIYAHEVFE